MRVRSGYKRTEVGIIPEDWNVASLGDLKPFVTSGSRGWASYYSAHGALFVRITNLSRESIYLDLEDSKFVTLPQGASEGIRTRLNEHDVLISITADIGIVGYVDASIPTQAYINQHIALARFDQTKTCGKFVSYFLASENSQKLFRASTDIGAKAGMSLATVCKIQTALPSLPEQRAIAAALSDVDELLGGLDRLIAKKRDLKQAAMQQLLTGQTRLPGFHGEWSAGILGNVVDALEAGVSVNSTDDEPSPGIPCVLKTSALSSGMFLPYEAKRIVPQDRIRAKTSPKRDTILISRMNTPDLVGEIAYVGQDYPWLFLPDRIWMTRFHRAFNLNVRWLAYVLSSNEYKELLRGAATGTSGSMKNIAKGALLALPVKFPKSEEQTAIATVLSDMDAELTALETRRDKTRALKEAMMQELLTGKTRLVPSGE